MIRLLWLCLLCLVAVDAEAAARAWFDRDTVTLGDTVTLNIEVDGVLGKEPDLSALNTDFRIRGSSSNASVSIVNGARQAKTLWAVALEPTRDGTLTVPALSVAGEQTAPLTLTVLPAPAGASGQAGDDAYLEVEAEPLDPYVQQQVRYTIRLFYAVPLLEGQLDEPQVDGARLQRIGNDVSFQRTIGGRRYQVVERQYALQAERSGALTVPAPVFRGRPAGRGLFSGGAVLQARGDALSLDVRARPAQAPTPWLPARELSLNDESGALPDQVHVGEPVTLSLRLAATGLMAEQLPELTLPDIAGAQVYPDRESSQTVTAGDWFRGERVRKFAIVPKQAGTLQLPAVTIHWWNTQTDQAATATVPGRTIEVLPAEGMAPAAPSDAGPGIETPAPAKAGDTPAPTAGAVRPWQWLAAALAALWLATLAWALWLRRRPAPARSSVPAAATAAPRSAPPALADALRRGDAAAIATALRTAPPDGPVAGLDAVAARLADDAQASAVRRFEQARYAGGDTEAAVQALQRAFAGGPRWRDHAAETADSEALPPLYR